MVRVSGLPSRLHAALPAPSWTNTQIHTHRLNITLCSPHYAREHRGPQDQGREDLRYTRPGCGRGGLDNGPGRQAELAGWAG